MGGYIACFVVGGFVGVLAMCFMQGSDSDDDNDYTENQQKNVSR